MEVPSLFVPDSYLVWAQKLVDFGTVNSGAFRARAISAPYTGVHPELLQFSKAFLADLKARGWPFYAHEYLRDRKAQDDAFKRGVSKAKFGQSAHNYGMAVDIVHYGRFWLLDPKEWALLGLIGKDVAKRRNIKITWGGDWKFYDPAHWELTDWKERIPA